MPAPPPMTGAFAVNAPELPIAVDELKYGTPPDVPDVRPVPPCVTCAVPVMAEKGGAIVAVVTAVN